MKKNWKGFLFALSVLILSTLIIIGLPLGWWPREPSQPFAAIILFWIIQITAALAVGELKEKLQTKPNYDCSEIKEENFFKIIAVSSKFFQPEYGKKFDKGFMMVDLKNFGETAISFPTHEGKWYGGYPKPGQVWVKRGNFFVLVQKEETC